MGDQIDRLYRAALVLTRSRDDAEDLVQDTYVRLLAKPPLGRCADDLAYLMKALRNTFLSNRRAASRRLTRTVALEEIEPVADGTTTGPEIAPSEAA